MKKKSFFAKLKDNFPFEFKDENTENNKEKKTYKNINDLSKEEKDFLKKDGFSNDDIKYIKSRYEKIGGFESLEKIELVCERSFSNFLVGIGIDGKTYVNKTRCWLYGFGGLGIFLLGFPMFLLWNWIGGLMFFLCGGFISLWLFYDAITGKEFTGAEKLRSFIAREYNRAPEGSYFILKNWKN